VVATAGRYAGRQDMHFSVASGTGAMLVVTSRGDRESWSQRVGLDER